MVMLFIQAHFTKLVCSFKRTSQCNIHVVVFLLLPGFHLRDNFVIAVPE